MQEQTPTGEILIYQNDDGSLKFDEKMVVWNFRTVQTEVKNAK